MESVIFDSRANRKWCFITSSQFHFVFRAAQHGQQKGAEGGEIEGERKGVRGLPDYFFNNSFMDYEVHAALNMDEHTFTSCCIG